MQEEVENRSVNLAVSTTKLTGRTLVRAIGRYLDKRARNRAVKDGTEPLPEGRQTVQDLMKSGAGMESIEVAEGSANDFCRIAKKLKIDYAICKNKNENPPRYVVFFKAKDTEVLRQALKIYGAEYLNQGKDSVLDALDKEKSSIREGNGRSAKDREKTGTRKHRKERTNGR